MSEKNVNVGGEDIPLVPLDQQLEQILYDKLGTDYRRDLSLTIRADALSWVVKLAIWGLEARTRKFRETPREKRDVSEAASLWSFEIDIQQMIEAVAKADVVPLPAKRISGKGSTKRGGGK